MGLFLILILMFLYYNNDKKLYPMRLKKRTDAARLNPKEWKGSRKTMEAATARDLAKTFVRGFYLQGNIYSLIHTDTTDVNIISFTPQSTQFARGRDAVIHALQKEYNRIAPCRIFRARFHPKIEGREFSVACLLALRPAHGTSLILHRLTLMYRLTDKGRPSLRGIHITRITHHESTYRIISSRMLSTIVGQDRAATQGHADPLVPPFTQSAFITYHMTDGCLTLTEYSDNLWRMLGYDSDAAFREEVGGNIMRLLSESEQTAIVMSITRQLRQKKVYQVEYSIRYANGRRLHIIEYGGQSMFHAPEEHLFHAVLLDITPLKEANDALMYQVSYDNLTGLFNHATFCQRVQRTLDTHPSEPFELMALDIARFKVINDLFGEDTGDRILRYLAEFFKETHLPQSVFGRLHSDIFLLFYPAKDHNRERFIKTLKVLAASFTLGYRITLRFGVYIVGDQRQAEARFPVTTMIDRAVMALSKAKRTGLLDCAEYSETMRHKIVTEQSIVNEMNEALAGHHFVIYLQPKYDAATETVVGAEALVRWIHPRKGLIPPTDFIPVFEHNGFIFQLDQYIWEETCRLLRRWLDEGKNPPPISVNVSRVDFYSPQLVNILNALVKKYNIPPRLLELELTESAYTDNPQEIIAVTKELQESGFKILMDDFGSGYSSLNMLKDLPVDVLKIDLKFLDQQGTTGRGGNILNSIVHMAKWMRMPVIVEGVETREQVNFLRTIGCEFIQGYFFAQPMPIEDYERIMTRQEMRVPVSTQVKASWPDIKDFDDLLDPNTNFNHLFTGIIGGIALYEFANGQLEGLRASENFFQLLNGNPGDVMNRAHKVLDSIAEEDRPHLLDAIERARTEKQATECIIRRRILDGTTLWLRERCSVILNSPDRLLLFITWEDVSNQYDIPIRLQKSLDNLPCGFLVGEMKDDHITINFANRWIYEMYNVPADDVLTRRVRPLSALIGQEMHDLFLVHTRAALKQSGPYILEYPRLLGTNELRRFRALIHAIQRPDGVIVGFANVYDVTDQPPSPHALSLTDPPLPPPDAFATTAV